jgi:hypothetical protein
MGGLRVFADLFSFVFPLKEVFRNSVVYVFSCQVGTIFGYNFSYSAEENRLSHRLWLVCTASLASAGNVSLLPFHQTSFIQHFFKDF